MYRSVVIGVHWIGTVFVEDGWLGVPRPISWRPVPRYRVGDELDPMARGERGDRFCLRPYRPRVHF